MTISRLSWSEDNSHCSIRKDASEPILFDQRLRRVNKASAARQRGRRPLFFVDINILFFFRTLKSSAKQ